MKTSTVFFWFFVAGGFITAAAYFASGESYRGTHQENYTILLQIPLGIVAFLYGLQTCMASKRSKTPSPEGRNTTVRDRIHCRPLTGTATSST